MSANPKIIDQAFALAERLTCGQETSRVRVTPKLCIAFHRKTCLLGKTPRTYHEIEITTYPIDKQRQTFVYDNRWHTKISIRVKIETQSLAGHSWTITGGYHQLRPHNEIDQVDPGLLPDLDYYMSQAQEALSRPNLIC